MKKTVWIYGIISGILLVILQAVHYKTFVREISVELFGLIVAAISIAFGLWLGIEVIKKKQGNLIRFQKAVTTDLSQRELEVLTCMAEGLSNQEIADKLFVSLNTIKTHNAKIFQKLNVARRTQAVKKAQDLNIISINTLER